MQAFYNKKIMDHYHSSPHRGFLEQANFIAEELSPSCGDQVVFTGKIEKDVFIDLKFKGEGSILGQAAASILCEYSLGTSIDVLSSYSVNELIVLLGFGPDLVLGPTRLRTVVFALETLQKGIRVYAESRKTL